MNPLYTKNLFLDLASPIAPLLEQTTYPWEALPLIKDFILELGATLDKREYDEIAPTVWVAKSATVAPSASLTGPVIVEPHVEIRHNAFIRGIAFIGAHSVVGNATELKNVVLVHHVQVPHYNYVGDSILGAYAHMGAGSITSNVKGDQSLIVVDAVHERIETGLKKFGAILGDHAEIGCNAVLNPGSVLGAGCRIYPLAFVRGFVPANYIFKQNGDVVPILGQQ